MLSFSIFSQSPTSNWYFGNLAGLSFSATPPTILTNGVMNVGEGCSTISDALGNLLFYTDGTTVWNKLHQIMANGTGLLGGNSAVQSALIVKEPGNQNIYYIFTVDDFGGPDGLRYSKIDMNLAAGLGSVTVQNILLYSPTTERLCGVKHCNGADVWVVSHDWNSNTFRSYLITSTGVNTLAIVSNIGTIHTGTSADAIGSLKISPNGKKLAITGGIGSFGFIELYDFNSISGIISNSLSLLQTSYGISTAEFSSDGSKIYSQLWDNSNILISQWNLCAGSPSAIAASQYTTPAPNSGSTNMQLAENSKIYFSRPGETSIGVINSPNALGAASGVSATAQSVSPNICYFGMPNFVSSYFYQAISPTPFNYSANTGSICNSITFSLTPTSNCSAMTNSIVTVLWNFGESISGSSNFSTLNNPTHIYSAPGTYTVQVILNYDCRSDTLKQSVTVNGPMMTISGKLNLCKTETTTLSVSGMNTYSWSNGSTSSLVALSPISTSTLSVIGTNTLANCSITKIVTVSVLPCTGLPDNLNTELSLLIYPNPNKGLFTIDLNESAHILILDILGRILYNADFQLGNYLIDLSKYENGLYFVSAKTKKSLVSLKILKE